MFKIITKADVLLFLVLLAVGAGSLVSVAAGRTDTGYAVISRGSTVILSHPLSEDCTVYLYPEEEPVVVPGADDWHETAPGRTEPAENVLLIQNGELRMAWSTCTNQICVNTGSIRETHQAVICLPHRLSAEIRESSGAGGVDAVSY